MAHPPRLKRTTPNTPPGIPSILRVHTQVAESLAVVGRVILFLLNHGHGVQTPVVAPTAHGRGQGAAQMAAICRHSTQGHSAYQASPARPCLASESKRSRKRPHVDDGAHVRVVPCIFRYRNGSHSARHAQAELHHARLSRAVRGADQPLRNQPLECIYTHKDNHSNAAAARLRGQASGMAPTAGPV